MVWSLEGNPKVRQRRSSYGSHVLNFAKGIIKKATKAKVAVYTCGIDISQTETKGTVLLKSSDELLNFTTGEEKHMEKVDCLIPSGF